MESTNTLPSKWTIIERLQSILKVNVSNNILFKRNGKNWTITFYNCDTEKYYKCTLKYGCLISNIREGI